jgi:hypothetical protein
VPTLGRLFFIIGAVFILLGIFSVLFPKIPYLGKLPGDIHVERKGVQIFFPITTCILLSIVLTVVMRLFRR